jgi:UDP-N-acetylmuramate dehydrogenase
VPRSYFKFGYDSSIIQKTGDIVLTVIFVLTSQKKEELWKIANDSIAHRRVSQPQGVQSSGCIFRNITKSQAISLATPNFTTSAGFLLDHAGLKGMRVGDAQVSPVHANFIINTGRARASDMVELIERARSAVRQKFGVILEEEIVRLGDF